MGNFSETIVAVPSDEANQEWLCDVSDADLLDAWVRDQLRSALAELITRYSVMVLSVCRRGCARKVDVDDAFQTTFLYLARNAGSIRHPERLPGWLQRVAQRSAVATWKTNRLRCEPLGDPPAAVEDPLDQLTHRHESVVLDEELADLPEKYRAVIVLHHYESTTVPDLAIHFGTTVGVIRGRLQRGRKMLAARLRQRGLMPAVAYASVTAGGVQNVDAAEAVSGLLTTMEGPELPDPPIDFFLLKPLLSEGMSKMLFLSKNMLVGGGLTLLLCSVSGDGGEGHQAILIDDENRPRTIQLMPQTLGQDSGDSDVVVEVGRGVSPEDKGKDKATTGQALGGMGGGGMGGGGNQIGFQGTHKNNLLDAWRLDSKTAENVREALDSSYKFEINVPLSGLSKALSDLTGQPILLNRRAVKQANQDLDMPIEYSREMIPLRAAMRQMLQPLYLRASIENDGIVITADHAALAKEGIGTDAWINVDQEMEQDFSAKREQKGVFEFIDIPLRECIRSLAAKFELKMIIREADLEDIGLTANEPITLSLVDITLGDALNELLSSLDLTYTLTGGLVAITSEEAAEERLLSRIYWLEGTGLTHQQASAIIQATVKPDLWQNVGGPSSISVFINPRAGLVISTTYGCHKEIERIMDTVRQSQFSSDPNLEYVAPPAPINFMGMGGSHF
ncbi:MAG: RNA polymerase sigma factor [Rubripirellula sp.]